ncbi:MAG: family 16 glycoside hydrolase, partial [Ginsengibacter sp.]
EGYWGCLWEEKRAGMVQKFPEGLADKLVKKQDWNHYYIIAKVHHIQAWLNGVNTIDTIHNAGFEEGSIGFQLCHGDKHTILDVKSLYIKEIK